MPEDNKPWLQIIPLLNSEAGQEIARGICEENDFTLDQFLAIVKARMERGSNNGNRSRLFSAFDEVFSRSEDDVD